MDDDDLLDDDDGIRPSLREEARGGAGETPPPREDDLLFDDEPSGFEGGVAVVEEDDDAAFGFNFADRENYGGFKNKASTSERRFRDPEATLKAELFARCDGYGIPEGRRNALVELILSLPSPEKKNPAVALVAALMVTTPGVQITPESAMVYAKKFNIPMPADLIRYFLMLASVRKR